MINYGLKGLAMNTKELKELVIFFKGRGESPTVKELCTSTTYINYQKNRKSA
jgi:hypothetical protein